jgi:hypothetical protein
MMLVGKLYVTLRRNRVIVPVCTSGSDEIVENCVGFLFGCLGDDVCARLALVLADGDLTLGR